MTITPVQHSSISQLLDRAEHALSGGHFSELVRRALRACERAADFDDSFIELRGRLRDWVFDPPAAVPAADAGLAFIEFVDRFTPEDGDWWYPVRDHDRYPEVADWFCEDTAVLHDIGMRFDLPDGAGEDIAAGAQALARSARRLLARLSVHLTDSEALDA